MVDIYRTRRGCFFRCMYWKRELAGTLDNETLIHKTMPNGIFYAKISSSKYQDTQDVANVFMFGTEGVNIETEDNVVDLEKNDLVLFKGAVWVVGRVNSDPIQRNAEYSSRESNKTYIELNKGR